MFLSFAVLLILVIILVLLLLLKVSKLLLFLLFLLAMAATLFRVIICVDLFILIFFLFGILYDLMLLYWLLLFELV